MSRPSVEELVRSSIELAEADRLEEALARVDAALRFEPRSIFALTHRGSLLAELGRIDDALDSFESALAIDKNDLDALLGAADLLVHAMGDEGESVEEALDLCRRGIKLAKKFGENELRAEFQLLAAMALNQLGATREALASLDEATDVLGDDREWLLERAITLFELCRFDEAKKAFESILKADPDEAWAHHHLGLLAEREGRMEKAEEHFAAARELSPEEFPQPIHLSEAEFDGVVEEALERLPEPVRRYLSNVAIAVEPVPQVDDLIDSDPPHSPCILGVFRGSPLAHKASQDPWAHFPSSIVLYQRNIERFALDREDLLEQIEVTLLHEVGHFLGFDEDDLAERGLD